MPSRSALYDAEIIHTVAERLKAYHAKNIVLDPVNDVLKRYRAAASRCGKGSAGGAVPAVHTSHALSAGGAAVCSHNITNREDMEQAAREIVGKTGGAVLVKGGHLQTAQMICCLTAQKCAGFPRRVLTTRTRTVPAARYPVQSHADCTWRVARWQRQAGQAVSDRLH